jgi:hypothetical protein
MPTSLIRRSLAASLLALIGTAASAVTITPPPPSGTNAIQAIDAKAVEGSTDVALIAIKTSAPVSSDGLGIAFDLGGTAIYGVDYDMQGWAQILPGQNLTVLCIQGLADKLTEGSETVVIKLTYSSDPNFTIGTTSSATVTIYDPSTGTSTGGWDLTTVKVM